MNAHAPPNANRRRFWCCCRRRRRLRWRRSSLSENSPKIPKRVTCMVFYDVHISVSCVHSLECGRGNNNSTRNELERGGLASNTVRVSTFAHAKNVRASVPNVIRIFLWIEKKISHKICEQYYWLKMVFFRILFSYLHIELSGEFRNALFIQFVFARQPDLTINKCCPAQTYSASHTPILRQKIRAHYIFNNMAATTWRRVSDELNYTII